MITNHVGRNDTTSDASLVKVDLRFEVVVIPVSDVDRAKQFYAGLGWRLDADFSFENGFRVVQFTPPGSCCSVQFGKEITQAVPGSANGLYLIASDVEAARAELVARGAAVSEVFHAGAPGAPRPITRATAPLPRSATPTATGGWCRRSQPACPGASTPPRRHSHRLPIWQARFGVRRPPTANTKSASARRTRPGPTGMPRLSWRSKPARNCRRERLRRHRAGGRLAG